ncbi:hypothetical protein PVAG01_10945 [Phlyctema vagabunda]|uniref:Ribosome biogenesis protein SLX9 n=1 Tax=Phlyctema vagabunda TaxID=108571 RepID=A0ABR4P3Q0_9HELO
MAPTAPKKRPSIRSKATSTSTPSSGSGSIAKPPQTHREGAVISDGFLSSKRDKRTIKHSAFVNRIEKAHNKPLKRRRPSKKLVTTLEGLADALPDMQDVGMAEQSGKMRMKGLRSRPGANKRKEKLERMERERFGKNMAQLSAGAPAPAQMPVVGSETLASEGSAVPAASATSGRWAALRGFISQTLEQKEEFKQ